MLGCVVCPGHRMVDVMGFRGGGSGGLGRRGGFFVETAAKGNIFQCSRKYADHILVEVDMVMQAVETKSGVVCQVDIWHEGTSSGDGCVYLFYGVWVEIRSWKDGGNHYFGCLECL